MAITDNTGQDSANPFSAQVNSDEVAGSEDNSVKPPQSLVSQFINPPQAQDLSVKPPQ
jgi:hypothetical protein